MGSSDTGAGVADCSIGSIVWVRRRNGSWWPGKILGPDELSAAHVMSPRSGTPVKLLGREDASVDWYNLEKSKRVKAFRCGEFDDCIERAEASQGFPPKKREKYARREDAILHALELEKQTLEKNYGKVGFSTNSLHGKSPNGLKGELKMSSENLEIGNGRHLDSGTQLDSKGLSISVKDKGKDQNMFSERVKEENELCLDDDSSGETPRMRGLRDFGLQSVPSSFKASPSVSPNDSHKALLGSKAQTHPNDSRGLEDVVDGNENSSDKRKRPHEGSGDDSLAKRRERRLPLHQVLENSSRPIASRSEVDGTVNLASISHDEQPVGSRLTSLQHPDNSNIGSAEDTETDSSETDLDSDTDELASLSEGAASIELQPKYPRRSDAREEQSVSSEEVDELAVENEISHAGYNDPSSSVGVSRWQLKGKRNTRNLVKKPVDGADRSFSWVSIDEITAFETGANGRDDGYSLDKSYRSQVARYGSRGVDGISRRSAQGQQWDWNDQHVIKGYWEDSGRYFDPVFVGRRHFGGRGMLVDVEVKVQSSSGYPREHVPMISLRSKLNDQAIVGHPVQIEALENGSTESLFAETEEWSPDIQENESALPPTWRTARRTANFRVPRPDLASAGEESCKHIQLVDSRRGCSGSFGHKGGILSQIPVDRKSSRKQQKKISLSSNQKTRTLSSIASQARGRSSDPRRSGNEYGGMDGLKPESLPTAVACIPVKLVFSRLQEELVGRHP